MNKTTEGGKKIQNRKRDKLFLYADDKITYISYPKYLPKISHIQ